MTREFGQSDYEVGDTVVYQAFGGDRREVIVENKEASIKNGRGGFDGRERNGNPVWGYDIQIIAVYRMACACGNTRANCKEAK